MTVYSIGGVTLPAGGDRVTAAGVVTPLSVTYPTAGYLTDEPSGFVDDLHVWYKLTAPATGGLILDSLLSSRVSDGTAITIELSVWRSNVGPSPSGLADCTSLGLPSTSERPLSVTAGTTYLIALWNFDSLGTDELILRVSDYGATGAWVQPSDQAWVESQDGGVPGTTFHDSSPLVHGNINSPLTRGQPCLHGSWDMGQALGGPQPIEDGANGVDCGWTHAARGEEGGQWWSEDPTNPDIDIAAAWHGGPAVCLPTTSDPITDSGADHIGGHLEATDPFGGADLFVDAYGETHRYWLTQAVDSLGPTGGLAAPSAPLGGSVEYEALVPELLGVDAAPDQTVHMEAGVDITVQWYGSGVDLDENPGDDWGPQREYVFPGDDFASGRFIGAALGPGPFIAAQDFQLPDFPPAVNVTDFPAWTALSSTVIDHVLATEAAWQAQWDAGIDLPLISNFVGALRFIGLFPEITSGSPPAALAGPEGSSGPLAVDDQRHGQFVALRLHVRPPRYRLHFAPVIPAVDGLLPIRLFPRGDELGMNPSPRVYPVQKAATRVYGQEP